MKVANRNQDARYRVKAKHATREDIYGSRGLPGISHEEVARRQAARNAAARQSLLAEFGVLTGAEVARRLTRKPQDKKPRRSSREVDQWKRDRWVFTVPHEGRSLYPLFQFDEEGYPRPVVAEILASIGQQSRGWELALWFISNNGWLGGRRPVDLLKTDPAAVSEAAKHEAFDLIF
ncbi:MAG TPA: hypothetical protein VFR03_17955 [Thermoanaerobaculia bacterium]|nr:hypothetical protein [Thermoanaerobaculia bacterium]